MKCPRFLNLMACSSVPQREKRMRSLRAAVQEQRVRSKIMALKSEACFVLASSVPVALL
jgi:hypothetical protein